MGWMTIPAFFVLGTLHVLSVVAGGTGGFIRTGLDVFVGAVALETFHVVYAVYGVVPLLVHSGRCVFMALRAWSKFFLGGQFRMRAGGLGRRGIL